MNNAFQRVRTQVRRVLLDFIPELGPSVKGGGKVDYVGGSAG